ncbi:uncharacterized protein FA14DRAFT_160543 [Meira miltonrushii]|uniref:CWH43-like N-terminal domain-containing protein n=1 Tax=Meira miltonrushii TaxID=1280837 RepID=A0A316VGB0_9BASI|nr:uncharacterized protein FA14DRAFT_160543 [Meira miltonrushii]PWN35363.1 hypothetical protein FA14DRAFT_160543 [Meira miltonrushii]
MKKPLHGYYFVVPIITFALWSACIFGLLGLWGTDGFPKYVNTDATVVFISDVGAAHHTYFIIFAVLSAVAYMATTLLERHLRHQRRIPGSVRKKQTVLDSFSVAFAIIGAIGLILLSIFDDVEYPRVHWSMTVVFVAGVALSVLMQTLQIFSLSKSHSDELWHLRAMAIVKSVILGVALAVLIVFIGCYATCDGDVTDGNSQCNRVVSAAGVAEWTLAFLLSLFFLSYIVDFWPAKKRADFGLTEKGDMVQDPSRAAEAGVDDRPTAPYAIARDMGPNHTHQEYMTQMSSEAPSMHQQPLREANHIGQAR